MIWLNFEKFDNYSERDVKDMNTHNIESWEKSYIFNPE